MMKGLIASGKTTEAKKLVEQGYKRVNKDDLRAMIDSSVHSKANEEQIIEVRDLIVINYLDQGYNVVVDDTNFAPIHEQELRAIAENCGADFKINYIDTPVKECVRRNLLRGEPVPTKAIWDMWSRYVRAEAPKTIIPYNKDLRDAYIFDIDGTLAIMKGRSPYEWDRVGEDRLNENVAEILDNLHKNGYKIIILTGRDAVCKEATRAWLEFHEIEYDAFGCRGAGDSRPDYVVKRELYEQNIKDKFNVMGVFDDRDQVVELWRELGLTCFQVAEGSF